MSDLTKQYFDKQLDKLATKEDIKSVKRLVQTEISGLETKLETKIENEVVSLAGMMSRRFDELEKKLDLRAEVDELKVKMSKVWNALNIKN